MAPPNWNGWTALVTSPEFEQSSPADRIRAILSLKTDDERFLTRFMEQDVSFRSYTQHTPKTCSVTFHFRVSRFYCNGGDSLHGGAQSTIYDMLTSIALQAVGGPWMRGHVSRHLNVAYLRPAPEGMDILCEVEVMSAGKSLALTRGVMKREKDGALISTCEHDKVKVPDGPNSRVARGKI